ncbi:MAG: hypothetical protein ACRD22_06930, partial [Terriglobia bacterium]
MSDIFEPEFDESPIEIDYTAPEPGKFPPQIEPGVYKLIFKLADKDAFTQKVIPTAGGTKQLVVLYAPEVILETGESKRIAFQNANSYKHPMV